MPANLREDRQAVSDSSPTAEQLKALRDDHGISQLQAAYIVHVSAATWEHWEAGISQMPSKLFHLFCTKIK